MLKVLESEPVFDKSVNYYSGRSDRLKRALERGKRITQIQKENDWDMDQYVFEPALN